MELFISQISLRHTKKCARLTDYYIEPNFNEPQEVEKSI